MTTIYLTPNTAPVPEMKIDVVIPEGGTTATVAPVAVRNLGGITKADINQTGGPLGLNGAGKITVPAPQLVSDLDITIEGPDSIPPNGQGQYKITNFHYLMNYQVSVTAGTVSISGDTITVNSPSSGTAITLSVNTKTYRISISGVKPVTPTILSPSNGSGNLSTTVTVIATSFAMPSGNSDTHKETKWQWSRDEDFTTLLGNVTSSTDKTQIQLTSLPYQTTVFVRVAYVGVINGTSNWSPAISFTIQSQGSEFTDMIPTGATIPGMNDPWTEELTTWTYANLTPSISSSNLPVEVQSLSTPGGSIGPIYANTVSIAGSGARGCHIRDDGVVTVYSINADVYVQIASFNIPGFVASNSGNGIAMNFKGDCFVVGEPNASPSGVNASGRAWIFREVGGQWLSEFSLFPSTPTQNGHFGGAVCINYNGSLILVGSTGGNSGKGSVYIFTKDKFSAGTWSLAAELKDDTGAVNDNYGASVKVAGNSSRVVVGAPRAGGNGKAFSYRRFGSTWGLESELVPSIPSSLGSGYGTKVEVSGLGNAIVVSRLAQGYPSGPKSDVTAFVWNGEQYVNKTVITGQTTTRFGISTRFSGNGGVLLIGSPDKVENGISTPQVVTYAWTPDPTNPTTKTWVEFGFIRPVTPASNSDFGVALFASADFKVMGSRAPLIGTSIFFRQPPT